MQDDFFDFENQTEVKNYEEVRDYEKESYGKFAYKRVQRLRRKGKRRGINVPFLGYELTKPDKPRTLFFIAAIISTVFLIGIIIGLAFLYNNVIKSVTVFNGFGDVFKAAFDPTAFALSAGLSTVPAIMIVLAYLLLITIFLLPLGALIYLYCFVRDVFYMAKCSNEEFAKGNIITSRIIGLIITIITATAIFAVILIFVEASNAKLLAGIIYGGILLVLGGLVILTIVEKTKCAKWFENLDEDNRENYLEHEAALRRVKRRLNTERNFWSNLGK